MKTVQLSRRGNAKGFIIHHHYVVQQAWISLSLSGHFCLTFITSGKSSGLHPVSSHSCSMYVRAGRPAFARPYVGVHRGTPLMSSSLLLSVLHVWFRLTLIVFVMGGRWAVSLVPSRLIQYCSQHSCVIAVLLLLQPFSQRPFSASIEQYRYDRCLEETAFHFYQSGLISLMIDSLSIALHPFVSRVSMSFSVDATMLPR